MIRADARSRLTAQDLDLLSLCLGGSQGEGDRELIRQGLDAVLDRPEVVAYLFQASLPGPSASLLLYVLTRHALLERGIDDVLVSDYCAALLREFGARRRANRVDDVDDQEYHYLVDILADLERSLRDRQFKVCVHLGNYALWLTGIFPEWIAARRIRRGGPDLSYYEALGRRGYAQASEHHLAERSGLDGVLQITAARFVEVRQALNRVSEQLALRGKAA